MEPQDEDSAAPRSEGPAWRIQLEGQWEALRRQVFRLDPKSSRKMSELGQECQSLAAVAAWYEAGGNITHAAERLGTSRQALRKRIRKWLKDNSTLLAVAAQRKQPGKWKGRIKPWRSEGKGP